MLTWHLSPDNIVLKYLGILMLVLPINRRGGTGGISSCEPGAKEES